jgi:hypothetical protein
MLDEECNSFFMLPQCVELLKFCDVWTWVDCNYGNIQLASASDSDSTRLWMERL